MTTSVLLARAQGIGEMDESFVWMMELGLGLLFEPFDWLISACDLFLESDWGALVGLLPIFPSAIHHGDALLRSFPDVAGNLRWAMDDFSGWRRAWLGRGDEVGDPKYAESLVGEGSQVIGRQLGALYDRDYIVGRRSLL